MRVERRRPTVAVFVDSRPVVVGVRVEALRISRSSSWTSKLPFATLIIQWPAPATLPSSYVHQGLMPVVLAESGGAGVEVGCGVGVGETQSGGMPVQPAGHGVGAGVGVGDGVGVGAPVTVTASVAGVSRVGVTVMVALPALQNETVPLEFIVATDPLLDVIVSVGHEFSS